MDIQSEQILSDLLIRGKVHLRCPECTIDELIEKFKGDHRCPSEIKKVGAGLVWSLVAPIRVRMVIHNNRRAKTFNNNVRDIFG